MVSKLLIIVGIGVFIAGIGFGFAVSNSAHSLHMMEMSKMHQNSGMGSMSGMQGMGSMSRHGMFYTPGSIHQLCHQDSSTSQAYCEPHYQVMSSIPGVKIVHIHPLDNNTLEVTLKEINTNTDGVKINSIIFVGNDFLSGKANVPSGWKGEMKIPVSMNGMGIVYDYESMHAHLFTHERAGT